MTWLAWRQQRLQILISIGLVLLTTAALVYLRFDAASLLPNQAAVRERYQGLVFNMPLFLLALPVLLGMFAGAPLFAREIEQGTLVFGLTQSISRTRWWATKLAVAGLPVTVAVTALGLVGSWALEPVNFLLSSRMSTPLFEIQGTTIGAYTVLAFAIGATAGLLVRSTLAGMAITLVTYLGVLVVVADVLRPHYQAPLYVAERFRPGPLNLPSDAWLVGHGYLDAAGNEISVSRINCQGDIATCFADQGVVQRFSQFHPGDRFWPFQLAESGLVLLLVGGLLALGAWALRRRLS